LAISRLSVIVPCYNEEENIRHFGKDLFSFFPSFKFSSEFLFVDDGSTDGTLEALGAILKDRSDAKIIKHPQNRGLGAAIRSGMAQAQGDAILTMDSDLTFHPREIPALINAYSEGVDAVLGSPVLGRLEGVSLLRKLLSKGVNLIYQILLARRITSTSSIFRLYRASKLKELDLKSDSFDINAEILVKMIQSGGVVREIPVTLTTRKWGQSKIQISREIKNHIKMFFRIIRWRLMGS